MLRRSFHWERRIFPNCSVLKVEETAEGSLAYGDYIQEGGQLFFFFLSLNCGSPEGARECAVERRC